MNVVVVYAIFITVVPRSANQGFGAPVCWALDRCAVKKSLLESWLRTRYNCNMRLIVKTYCFA